MTRCQLGLLAKMLRALFLPLLISKMASEYRHVIERGHRLGSIPCCLDPWWSLLWRGLSHLNWWFCWHLLLKAAADVINNLWSVLSAHLGPGISPYDLVLPQSSVVLCIPPEVWTFFPKGSQIRCFILESPAPELLGPHLVTFSKLSQPLLG